MYHMYNLNPDSMLSMGVYLTYLKKNFGEKDEKKLNMIRVHTNNSYNPAIDTINNNVVNIYGFKPEESIIIGLLDRGNSINHFYVMEDLKDGYSQSVTSNKKYNNTFFYSNYHTMCNSLLMWRNMFNNDNEPFVINAMNIVYNAVNNDVDIHTNEFIQNNKDAYCLYHYLLTIDSYNHIAIREFIMNDIKRTMDYENCFEIGSTIADYMIEDNKRKGGK